MKILIIGYVWPEPESSAAGLRSLNLVDAFLGVGWEVCFASSSPLDSHAEALQNRGARVERISANDPSFDVFVKNFKPDAVVFDRFVIEEQFGWRVQEVLPQAIRVIDTQDLHFLRRTREALFQQGKSPEEILKCSIEPSTNEHFLREIGAILRSDCSLILSGHEYNLLTQHYGITKERLELLRFFYPEPRSTPGFEERKHFMMLGNFRHHPNADAVRWLRELWPKIAEKIPGAEVHIYGAYPPREIMNLSDSKSGFLVRGPARDLEPLMRSYRVNLAPLRFGAGIKGKITDGWSHGLPVVCTPIGAEGMSDDLPWGGEIAHIETAGEDDFVAKSVSLYQDAAKWSKAQEAGTKILRELYSFEKGSRQLITLFENLRTEREAMRSRNWMGSILNYNLYRATKYFSKWIEQKNAKPI